MDLSCQKRIFRLLPYPSIKFCDFQTKKCISYKLIIEKFQDIPENGADVAHLNAIHADNLMCGKNLPTVDWWNIFGIFLILYNINYVIPKFSIIIFLILKACTNGMRNGRALTYLTWLKSRLLTKSKFLINLHSWKSTLTFLR